MKNPESIKKMSETKNEQERLELIDLIKEFKMEQVEHDLKISSNRKNNYITFNNYKQKILNGQCPQNIILTTSKHVIGFYNYILKNAKNIISKEIFESEYNNGSSLNQISTKYEIPREHITHLRDFYGIKRKGATFIKRIANEQPLSQEAQDVIIGSMLGDGSIDKFGNFREKHSEKQVEYLEWKASFLKNIWNNNPLTYYVNKDKRSGTTIYSFQLVCKVHSFTIEMRNVFYENGNKIIPKNIESLINEKVLAIWFMDDGMTDWGYRNGIKKHNVLPICKLCSESFTKEENTMLQEILYKKWKLVTKLRFKVPNCNLQPRIIFNSESSQKLIDVIKKFSTQELLYKFDSNEYVKHKQKKWDENLILQNYKIRHNLK